MGLAGRGMAHEGGATENFGKKLAPDEALKGREGGA